MEALRSEAEQLKADVERLEDDLRPHIGKSRGGPRGGWGGYHCSTAAGYPKLDSTLEILAVEQVG